MKPLENRIAIVTGAAQGIGAAIARKLATDGATVAVADVNIAVATKVAAECGGESFAFATDVSEENQVAALHAEVRKRFGRLDILVNSAAIRRPVKFEDLTFTEWRLIMSIILDGTFLCCHAAAPHLRRSGHGRIVNIGGITSHIGAHGRAHVVAAKAGVVGLTKALALDLGDSQVTVNCVAPGMVEAPEDDAVSTQFRRQHTPLEKIPLGRVGTPDDVGRAVATLCSDELAYVTGQTLHLNGGVFLW
jgi:3-oxoacyl-[acyl-carrier protein] reductase